MPGFRKSICCCGYILLVSLTGCGTAAKPYHSDLAPNLTVRLTEDSAENVNYRVEVYRVDSKCSGEYQGTVYVKNRSVTTGIPVGKPSLLSFNFSRVNWLHNSTSNVLVDALVKPGAGFQYEAVLYYANTMYDVKLYQTDPKTGKKSKVDIVDLNACKSQS